MKAEAPFTSTPWNAQGQLRIGAGSHDGNPSAFFKGMIDEVRVYDRIIVASEAEALSYQPPVVQARWKLNEASTLSPAESPDDTGHGHTLSLAGEAHVDQAAGLVGSPPGAVVLDGAGDYAATSGPVVSTKKSFTVAGWVTTQGHLSANATLFSQAGAVNSGFIVRYAPSAFDGAGGYQIEMPEADVIGAVRHTAENGNFQSSLEWDHVAIVYDAGQDEMRLYVNGEYQAGTSIQPNTVGFDATGDFQIGRSLSDGVWGEYWPGTIDDVWVFSGVLSQDQIQNFVAFGEERPTYPPS